MTEKELRKLHRHDLLELLVEQSKEAARLRTALQEKEEEFSAASESNERLKDKLNEKDALIEKLKARLDEKDKKLEEEAAATADSLERLKEKLNAKDSIIENLRAQVDRKEKKIEKLEVETERLRSNRWEEMKDSGLSTELLARLKTLL